MRMVKKKRRHNGHYCKICGCYKSNESFTGKGHARHICKQCQSLPKDEQADMMRCVSVEILLAALTFGGTVGNGLHPLTKTVCILSKVAVGIPNVTIAAAKNQMT